MPDIISQDALFRYLVKFHIVENFYKRGRLLVRDGEENPKLVAPLIVRDLPSLRAFVRQQLTFRHLDGLDVRQTLVSEAHLDGAYVLEKRMLSNKVFLQNLVQSTLRDGAIRTIENLQKRYLPSDYIDARAGLIGTKTQNALCAGLRGGKGYLIKQTAYGRTGLGKVCLFDHTGLRAEFFLKQDLDGKHPSGHYYHPLKRVIGVLNESPTENNDDRTTTIVTPLQLGISPGKYLNLTEKFASNVSDFFRFVQLA